MSVKKISLLFCLPILLLFYKLGSTPLGISVSEAGFGLKLAEIVGNWVLNPVLIRIPNVILGILTLILFYLCLRKLKFDKRVAIAASFIVSISPWFIGQTRICSSGNLLSVGMLVFIIIVASVSKKSHRFLGLLFIIFASFLLVFSLFRVNKDIKENVDVRRTVISRLGINTPPILVTNKFVESYRYHEKLFFANLDFGNYLFRGHPRERGGVEETQKLLIVFLPLFAMGIIKIDKNKLVFTFGWWFLTTALLVFFEVQDPGYSLPLIFPMIIPVAVGTVYLIDKRKILFVILVLAGIVEHLYFLTNYFSGFEESLFTPRRPVYERLVPEVIKRSLTVNKVVISQRLKEPHDFFFFYSQNNPALDKFEFKDFDIRKETDKNTLFVDVLPDEPSPAEPLYDPDGNWPKTVNVLADMRDENLRQQDVVLKLK